MRLRSCQRQSKMDIWNMAHVEDGEKYYIRKEYTEVSELQLPLSDGNLETERIH